MALRNLRMIADARVWNGKPSVTQLLKGTRESYLEISFPYYINPQDAIFRIIGTKAHAELDKYTADNEIGEIRLELEGITGAFDYYEDQCLYDSKTYGSYKVMKCLGIEMVDEPTGEVYKTGPKKGQAKTKKVARQGIPDLDEQKLQLNMYRLMLEDSGFPVQKMFLDIAVRDGGIQVATTRGVERNAYLIEVPRMADDEVLAYFRVKRDALLTALENRQLPPPCSIDERWQGRKCQSYCNVAEWCDLGGKS
ncbi:MAG: hypothetical protein BWY95_02810 [Bacteroidetes bacterium ADurb.BinA104]|nr:MAG: hypothetical protein BWY95_02810 [Bacteroidetes bacterium ADurb.BinA104]